MLGVSCGETEEVWGGIGFCKRSGAEKQGFGVPRGDKEVGRRNIYRINVKSAKNQLEE